MHVFKCAICRIRGYVIFGMLKKRLFESHIFNQKLQCAYFKKKEALQNVSVPECLYVSISLYLYISISLYLYISISLYLYISTSLTHNYFLNSSLASANVDLTRGTRPCS